MADEVPIDESGLVIELGAGTGVVTAALLRRGVAPDRLILIERSRAFVDLLRGRFPDIRVIHESATRLGEIVPGGARITAIVSSLPLYSLPRAETNQIISQWRRVLKPHGVIVQFSYHLLERRSKFHCGTTECSTKIVWTNLPPARVRTVRLHD